MQYVNAYFRRKIVKVAQKLRFSVCLTAFRNSCSRTWKYSQRSIVYGLENVNWYFYFVSCFLFANLQEREVRGRKNPWLKIDSFFLNSCYPIHSRITLLVIKLFICCINLKKDKTVLNLLPSIIVNYGLICRLILRVINPIYDDFAFLVSMQWNDCMQNSPY